MELEHGGTLEQWVFQFSGRDTLLLREGDRGYPVEGSEVQVFVRAPLGRLPDQGVPYDQRPVPIVRAEPQYPAFAREARVSGTVVLHVLVGEDGRVQNLNVVQSVLSLDEAAVQAVKQWKFKPALKGGLPVAAWFEVPFTFQCCP